MTYPMAPFQLHHPGSVAEALELAGAHPGAPFLAGGTDLVVNLRKRLAEPEHVISLRGLSELEGVSEAGGWLAIGARTTIAALAAHPLLLRHAPVLAEAAALVAGPTIRGMATLGGNLLLDTRCKYYNQSYFWRQANDFCLKKDGSVCHVAPKGDFCWAGFSADTPPVLLALGAELEIASASGTRRMPLTEFYGADGRWSIGTEPGGLAPGELLLRVHLPNADSDWAGAYEKIRVRDSIDYPLAGVCLMLARTGGREITGLRLTLTALNPAPLLVPNLDDLAGRAFSLEVVDELTRRAGRIAKPLRTAVADPAWRRAMVGALIEKAAARLAPELAGPLAGRAQLP
ncbi:MAG: FAD binding domain-containing protein [SAR324 cluster bacterium]|nr:FAD binding domain-containing protein [SAR324 cluster bacterium]